MISKQGAVPEYLPYLIMGLIVLVVVSIYFIGKPIPQTFQDFQSLEKELTQQWNIFRNGTQPQTVEDAAFLKTYSAFISSFSSCMHSSLNDCRCELTVPSSFPKDYHIFLGYDSQGGYYSYAYVSRNDKRILLNDRDILFGPVTSPRLKGYLFLTDISPSHLTQKIDIFLNDDGKLQLLTPPEDVPSTSKQKNFFTYNIEQEILLLHKTPLGEPRFIPSSLYYPAPSKDLFNRPTCLQQTPQNL